MNLIINIPEEAYKQIMEFGFLENTHGKMCYKAIKNGTPIPDNATNGDVIKAMFPKLEYKYTVIDEYTNKPTFVLIIDGDMILTNFSTDWWNAPYQKGGKE